MGSEHVQENAIITGKYLATASHPNGGTVLVLVMDNQAVWSVFCYMVVEFLICEFKVIWKYILLSPTRCVRHLLLSVAK